MLSRTAQIFVRPLLAGLCLAALSIGPVPPALAEEPLRLDMAQLPQSEAPYLELAELDANTANVFRTLVPADETAGITQILALVGRSSFEEQWAFVPAKGLWIEIGHNELASEMDSEVETDLDYLKGIVGLYHEVRIFHFHPASYYPRVLPVDYEVASLLPDDFESIGYALPSPTDIVTSLRLTELLHDADPEAKISYAVISPHGLVTYGMTAPGFKTIDYEDGNPRATTARSIITRIAIRRLEFNIVRTARALAEATIGDVIADLCAQASDENYRVSFTAF